MRVAVIGHIELVTITRIGALPSAGDIAHLDAGVTIAGGGGGVAFGQLARSRAEAHFFTAVGNDDAAAEVLAQVHATGTQVHAAPRDEPHTRGLVLLTPDGQRTIFIVGEPLHPRRSDDLRWDLLASCDGVYFTGQDPDTIVAARSARVLVVTARRREALVASGVRADVVVGSAHDAREASTLADYPVAPDALVMTEHGRGGYIETKEGVTRFAASAAPDPIVGTYGAGDTFAAALTWYLARGLATADACRKAAPHAAAVLADINPLRSQAILD
jgi:ribokinase